ncbi:hypothetical protein Lpp22_1886 [Lacticaseibacillus paracasei subsp. paracasei Lpp22]|uniref:Uncharacterized protein n=1 Tax=Lacticaseibacillus paracasei subsp. paracasei Lpp22 TaxID=1256221 RepID=A0A8E0I9F6_LACPA|nr:hypothetical protein Lpp22_1886 [Lacticaseibacillus paracasei subsp. paracasei Lpp22]
MTRLSTAKIVKYSLRNAFKNIVKTLAKNRLPALRQSIFR